MSTSMEGEGWSQLAREERALRENAPAHPSTRRRSLRSWWKQRKSRRQRRD